MGILNSEDARAKAKASAALAESPTELLQNANLDVDATTEAIILSRLAEMPSGHRNGYVKAMSGSSKAAGIKAFCLECVCWERVEVTRCSGTACPLWPYRPFQPKGNADG